MDFPFTEIQINEGTFIREFSSKVDEMELIWHRDKENRHIKVLEGNGWKGHGPLKIELHKLND